MIPPPPGEPKPPMRPILFRSSSSTFAVAAALALALAPAVGAQNFDHPGEVWFAGRWGKPADAEAAGWFEYRDRWLPKSLEPKLRQWEKEDAKGLAWNRAYTLKTRHYQLRTNVPRFVAELELRPFLDALYAHFTATFRERFGLEGKGANFKTVNVYSGFATYFEQTQRPRSNPGYIVGGAELHALYEESDLGGFYQTMFHEGAHQFVAGLMPGATLPHWMNEALATHFEAFTWSRATQTIRELAAPPDRLEHAKHQLARAAEADPEQMFMRFGQADYNGFHYALGWSYLHFLLHVDAERLGARFGALLKALNGSGAKPFAEVFRSVYKEDLAALASRWKPYVLELPQPDRWQWVVLGVANRTDADVVHDDDLLVSMAGRHLRTAADFDAAYAAAMGAAKPVPMVVARKKPLPGTSGEFERVAMSVVVPIEQFQMLQVKRYETRSAGLAD